MAAAKTPAALPACVTNSWLLAKRPMLSVGWREVERDVDELALDRLVVVRIPSVKLVPTGSDEVQRVHAVAHEWSYGP
jgi:hypothetical protein